ncbi:thioredoxin-like protein [Gilbertella persicaria]|uniref:Glutaredoxin domain-containing protein n=1 Tax=Rhizopus stolonifer TaxID=4846 RepID=A0A367J4N7_RHIST|nr:thioredoxin-like protein [Gilbertella persicaria]KAI8074256.1 thioredoxin-like protein [Gilbertella persicaria]RCH84898.1 hypothetical protein CU098_005176 [Rhizopus stolonifer]
MSSAQQIVEEAIKNNRVVIFSKSYCPFCKKAKALFDELKVEYTAIELDLHDQGADIQAYLAEKTGQRTVPNIFVNQKHVGGSDDLAKAKENGTLEKLL